MAVVADTTPVFPAIPNYGFIASPRYRVQVIGREGGFERVNRLWSRPLLHITAVPLEDATVEDMEEALNFFHAMGGPSTYFRVLDYTDYKSCGVNSTPAATDQPLVEIGTSGTYQLVKHYTVGAITQVREIYKPRGSTIVVANEVQVLQSDWSLDEATGVLTPGGSFSGTPTSWGGEFEVEVRFLEEGLSVEIATYGTRNARLAMRERRRAATT